MSEIKRCSVSEELEADRACARAAESCSTSSILGVLTRNSEIVVAVDILLALWIS